MLLGCSRVTAAGKGLGWSEDGGSWPGNPERTHHHCPNQTNIPLMQVHASLNAHATTAPTAPTAPITPTYPIQVHGSAPDIAGQDKANPLAMILSAAMMCRYGLNLPGVAARLEAAVTAALDGGYRTGDIMQPGCKQVGVLRRSGAHPRLGLGCTVLRYAVLCIRPSHSLPTDAGGLQGDGRGGAAAAGGRGGGQGVSGTLSEP